MPNLPQFSNPAQANAPTALNANLVALEHQAVYAMSWLTTTLLTWGYFGGRWGGFAITAGTVTLTASSANYVVVAAATGVLSASTSTTNWNDSTNYVRVYKVTTGTTAPSAIEDHRAGPKGVHGGAGSGGGGGGGSGTVTNTGGNLTANAVVLGAGTVDTKVAAGIVTDGTSKVTLGVAGSTVGAVTLANATSGTVTLQPVTGALGSNVLSLPAATDTLVGKATTDTLTNKTLTNAVVGTQTAGDNSTKAASTAYVDTKVATLNSQSSAYTFVMTDEVVYHPPTDTTARIWTVPANASVAYPIGKMITLDNDFGAGVLTVAITTDTMVLVGAAGSTGSRTIAAGGQATLLKVAATRWRINGTLLT